MRETTNGGVAEPRGWRVVVIDGPGTSTERSFDSLYRAEYRAMVRLAYALVGSRSVAEEVVQEAFLDAHRRWNRLHTYDRPGAWIRRVVLQRCARRRRDAQREGTLYARLRNLPEALPRDDGAPDPLLLAAIQKLPKRQGQVVALIAIDDRSVASAAEILGCSEETVRTHFRRARLALRSSLQTPISDQLLEG